MALQGGAPQVISWFITHENCRYIIYKPTMALEIPVIIRWHFRRNVLRLIPGEAATEATPPDGMSGTGFAGFVWSFVLFIVDLYICIYGLL